MYGLNGLDTLIFIKWEERHDSDENIVRRC